MKTVAALLLALASLAAAQFRLDPPQEISLRNVPVTSKEFKDALVDAERKANSNALRGKSDDEIKALVGARMTKENPGGSFLTQDEFIERLKKGEKFFFPKKSLGRQTCKVCLGVNFEHCKTCKGKGKVYVVQDITYLW